MLKHNKIFAIIIGTVILIATALIFPFPAWLAVIKLSNIVEQFTGFRIELVSNPSDIALGAVIVSIAYYSLCFIASKILMRYSYKHLSATLDYGGIVAAMLVFYLVSAIIWF